MKYLNAAGRKLTNLFKAIITFIGGVLIFIGGVTLLCAGIYTLYIWWGVVSKLEFLGLAVAAVFFAITVPLAPIYVGMQGDWGPTIIIILGIFCGGLVLIFGGAILRSVLESSKPDRTN